MTMGLTGFCLIVMLLGFWRVHVARTATEVGGLSGKVDRMVALWSSHGVAEKDRVADLVITDAESGPDPFALASEEPSAWDNVGTWLRRTFMRRSLSAKADSQFAKAFADDPAAAVWTHEGFATVSEAEMTNEIVKAVVKANEAGAEVNIVAQGASAGPVLKAMKSLVGARRKGAQVGVKKVVLVGMDMPRLKRSPGVAAYDPTRLGNIIELADIWTSSDSSAKATKMQVYSLGQAGAEVELEKLWPESAAGGGARSGLPAVVRDLVTKAASLEQCLARQEQALKDAETKKAAEEAAVRQAAAKKAADEAAARWAEAQRGALEAIRQAAAAKKTAQEAAQREAAARKAAEIAAQKKGGSEHPWVSQGQRECAQCCVDAGGRWDWGPETGQSCMGLGCQVIFGCCRDADYDAGVASCRAAIHCRHSPGNHYYYFRCGIAGIGGL